LLNYFNHQTTVQSVYIMPSMRHTQGYVVVFEVFLPAVCSTVIGIGGAVGVAFGLDVGVAIGAAVGLAV
jgi:hypothetical protein